MAKKTDDIKAYQRAWYIKNYKVYKPTNKQMAKKRELYRKHLAETGIRDRSLLK
jgi:hypothetical protein